ncbi:MAG: purine-nucleoside phosphorylase, partial [Acidobacteria bacterium]|nr:purine-nucleoside phosphorylase [Acidobacteriota bacterium]
MKTETAALLWEAAGTVRRWWGEGRRFPGVGVVLGSGLAGAAAAVLDARSLPYREIPGFRDCSAPGHRRRLVAGELAGEQGTRP